VFYYLLADKRLGVFMKPLLVKTVLYAGVMFIGLSVVNLLFLRDFSVFSYALLAVVSSVFFLFINCFSIARKYVLRETKKVSELIPGDILAQNLVRRKGHYFFEAPSVGTFNSKEVAVSALDAGGIELCDIALFKKLKIKSVELKKSLPFVPVFFLGAAIVSLLEMLL
jgi:prepilin signal peptidase PulO-like enzyme (type II secretory pathway)